MKAFYETRNYNSSLKVWHKSYRNIHFIPHWHTELELIFVREGKAEIFIEDKPFIVSKGDLVVCDSGLIHYSSSKYMDNYLEFLIFDPTIIHKGFNGYFLENPVIRKEELENDNMDEALISLLQEIRVESQEENIFFEEIITSVLTKFCLLLYRKTNHLKKRRNNNKNKEKIFNFKNLLYYIENNFDKNITLKDGAEAMNLNESYFSTLFKNYTGYNFVNYINIIRTENAVSELLETQSSITEIAFNQGFNNIKSFNRVFKDVTGMTPSQVRKQEKDFISFNPAKNRKSAIRKHTDDHINKTLVTK